MNILPNSDPMFSYPQNIQDLIYLLVGIIEEKRREGTGGPMRRPLDEKWLTSPGRQGKRTQKHRLTDETWWRWRALPVTSSLWT